MTPERKNPEILGAASEAEKQKREREQKELRDAWEKREQFESEKSELSDSIETRRDITRLRSLVERGLLKPETLTHALSTGELSSEEIDEIFEKIDEIEQVQEIDKILPVELRPNKDEFMAALYDPEKRAQVLQKIDRALRQVSRMHGGRGAFGGMFGSFLLFLSTSLRTVQENLIDLKRTLVARNDK